MCRYRYTLTKEEYLSYCKHITWQDKSAPKLWKRLFLSVPLFLILLGMIFRPAYILFYIVSLIITLIWFPFSRFVMSKILLNQARKLFDHNYSDAVFEEVELFIGKGTVLLNSKNMAISNFFILPEFLVLVCKDGTNILLPSRLFQNKKEISDVIRKIS